MKKITLAVFIFALSLTGFNAKAQGTQPDNTECFKYMSYYQEYYKQKNYDEAIPSWRRPTASALQMQDRTSISKVQPS